MPIDALSVLCAQLTRDLLAIAKFLFHVVVEGQRGAFQHRSFPATSGRGAGTPKLAQIFAYGKRLYPYIMLHGASDLDQRCLKTRNSEDECTYPPNVFAPTPKITPNPNVGGPFFSPHCSTRVLAH